MGEKKEILNELIFDTMDVSDLLKDIYDSIKDEDETISTSITQMMDLFANPENGEVTEEGLLGFIAPTIKDFLDIAVKNKKNLIDLATVTQKFLMGTRATQEIDDVVLSDSEREKIFKDIEGETDKIQSKVDIIHTEKETIKNKHDHRKEKLPSA